eukprot:TRINITY_DN47573_c0_g1_i1.p1 TRINITY_DN47573_c0_g1~~TRINITY_DN47573_c0_g1_i1.p1  ORF type:complete len:258 (-),score=27.80 TRINITY_DN47573_c0_g1_i1:127-837(-)
MDGSTCAPCSNTFSGNVNNLYVAENRIIPHVIARFVRMHPLAQQGSGGYTWQVEFLGKGPASNHSQVMLSNMWLDCEFADCKVICGGREFLCHRIVLGTASVVWRAAFTSAFREARDATININGADVAAVEALLQYVYKGEFNDDLAMALLPLAHLYEVHELVGLCAASLRSSVSKDNVVEVVSLMKKFIDHEKVAVEWPPLVERVRADPDLADTALRAVRVEGHYNPRCGLESID